MKQIIDGEAFFQFFVLDKSKKSHKNAKHYDSWGNKNPGFISEDLKTQLFLSFAKIIEAQVSFLSTLLRWSIKANLR